MSPESALKRLRRRRRMVLALFAVATAVIACGFWFGPRVPSRGLFELPGDPVYEADQRALRQLPAAEHSVFLFVGGSDPQHHGNALSLGVLRELLARRDRLMDDVRVTEFLRPRANPLAGHPTSGPWSIAEAVRDIMDGNNPRVPWAGPDFAHIDEGRLDTLLGLLFGFGYIADGQQVYPFRSLVTEDLHQDDAGVWHASGLVMPVSADEHLLQAAVESGWLRDREQWEQRVDSYYAPPLPSSVHEDVRVWSYAGINTQIDTQVDATLPLVGLAFAVMVILVAIFFRNWKDLIVVTISLALLMLWLSGIQAWLGYPATQLSSMLPVLVVALGVDFAIHSLYRWRLVRTSLLRRSPDPVAAGLAAAAPTVRGFVPALGLTTLTTIFAFGSAVFSPIPDLREWGVLAVAAIVAAYLLLGSFAVYLRSGLAMDTAEGSGGSGARGTTRWAERVAIGHARGGHWLLLLFLLVSVAMLAVGTPGADFDVQDYVAADSRFVRSLRMEQDLFPASGEPSYMLIEGRQLGTPEIVRRIQHVIDALPQFGAQLDIAIRTPTFIDALHMQQQLIGQDPSFGTAYQDADSDGLPDSSANLVAVLSDIRDHGTRDRPDADEARQLITPADAAELFQLEGSRLTRVRVRFNVPRPEDWELLGKLLGDLRRQTAALEEVKDVHVHITGLSYTRYQYVNDLTSSFTRSTWIAILLCALVVLLAFRNLRLGVLTVLPVLVVAIWLQAIMVLMDISLNIVTVQVISLAIGLGIDYPIHVTQRLREARGAHPGGNPVLWMARAIEETGPALLGSALTTLAGFLILLLSPMPLFVMFGTIMTIMIVLALMGGLILLPALLLQLGKLS